MGREGLSESQGGLQTFLGLRSQKMSNDGGCLPIQVFYKKTIESYLRLIVVFLSEPDDN